MKTRIYLLFLLLITAFQGLAQTNSENLQKYWQYRARFLGKDGYGGFISVGPGQGQSIPASARNIDCNCMTDWHLLHSKTPTRPGEGLIKWGDATVHLGYYLAMLAMEYKNLRDTGAQTMETARELYFALKAYERLDSLAEVTLGLPPNLNGFFLRDDIPNDFYINPNNPDRKRFEYLGREGYTCIGSDYSKGTRAVDNGSYISQDQVTSLLVGFAFVKKFAGDGLYVYESKETFGQLAEKYTHLIVSYMRDSKWRLKSPDGQKIPGRWGGDARAFSTLFASAAKRITEGKYNTDYNEKVFLSKLVKGSYRWAFGLHNNRNYSMIFRLMMLSNQWSSDTYAKRAKKADKIFYALANAVLNDRQLDKRIDQADFKKMIDTAPKQGPCSGLPDCEAPDGWKSQHLWFHTKHRNGDPYGFSYEYPGIDYMLLYNLYHYYYRDQLPAYQRKVKIRKRSKQVKASGYILKKAGN